MRNLLWLAALLACAVPSQALAATSGCITGSVFTGGRIPIAGAVITLSGDGGTLVLRSNKQGTVAACGLKDGMYSIAADARGYARIAGRSIDVRSGETASVTLEFERPANSLSTIGTVRARGTGEAISTSPALTKEIDAQTFAAAGYGSVADILAEQAIATAEIRASGSGPGPVAVALRGPDPTETLVDVDGHSLNSGGTGGFDLSLLDPASLSGVQLIYGIAPASMIGPNTIDGVINVRTLDPTAQPQALLRFAPGSFGSFAQTFQASGSRRALGYAVALHHAFSAGEVNEYVTGPSGTPSFAGSASNSATGLLKVSYAGPRGEIAAFSVRDQSSYRDLSAALTSRDAPSGSAAPGYNVSAGSAALAHDSGYSFDLGAPLGRSNADGIAKTAVVARHLSSYASQSVEGPAAGLTPYLYNDRDVLADDSLEIDRLLPKGSLSLKLAVRTESLNTQQFSTGATDQSHGRRDSFSASGPSAAAGTPLDGLSQVQRSAVVRYAMDPTAELHYSIAAYASDFSSFGTSFDPRFGVVWTPKAGTALRASFGTSFQSPQLPELFVPAILPAPSGSGYVEIGNPNLKADHATNYGVGLEHVFIGANPARMSLDLYQTNLRTPSQRFYPSVACPPLGTAQPSQCVSYPINAGGAIYRGVQLYFDRDITPATRLRLAYDVASCFATSVSPEFQNGSIVPGEQFQGVPLRKGIVQLNHDPASGVGYSVGLTYEGDYNALNRPPFATLRAGMTLHAASYDIGLYANNLTNVYADRFTLAGRGVPYGGADGAIPTNAYSLESRSITLVLTGKMRTP